MLKIILLLFFLPVAMQAQEVRIRGQVLGLPDQPLGSANISIQHQKRVAVSDRNGEFTIMVAPGNVTMEVSYTGFKKIRQELLVKRDTLLHFVLEPLTEQLDEVVVSSSRFLQSDQLQTTRMSSVTLGEKEINSIPVLGGEADLIKVIQLLPGVTKGVQGSTDLFVRGGAADQNLVLLDGAPVYNTGHLFGFLSVFNPDVLSGVESMNGAFPAEFGGRLSSILDVRTKSSMTARTQVKGNIGLLASRLMIEQPLLKDKLSFMVAARRTYVDQVVKLAHQELPYFFYDLNAKVLFRPTRNDEIEITHYSGDDILDFVPGGTASVRARNVTSNFTIGNASQTVKWRKAINPNWNSNVLLYHSTFRYTIQNTFEDNRLYTSSNIDDLGGKWTLSTDSLHGLFFKTGLDVVKHQVSPNIINTSGQLSTLLESSSTQAQSAWEASTFGQVDGNLKSRWRWSAGIRISSGWVNHKMYVNPEPRLAIRYSLGERTTVKASYSKMTQYLHRVSSAAVAFPTDIWYPVTDSIQPQRANQYSIAFQHTVPSAHLFLSFESYYKTMDHLIGYREGTNLFLNTRFESSLIQGNGRAYGAEVLIKKESGKLTGWISYSLSWSERQFNEINGGQWFYARYDRRHNAAVVANYQFAKRWSFSAVWEFISGSRFTPVIGQYAVPTATLAGVNLVPVYAPINSVRLADTHRLDLGMKFRPQGGKKFQGEWFAGVYNTYNRATPIGIVIQPNGDGSFRYVQPGLFGFLPFVSYGFKF